MKTVSVMAVAVGLLVMGCTTVVVIETAVKKQEIKDAKQDTEASKDDGRNRPRVEAPEGKRDQHTDEGGAGVQRR